MMKIRHGLMVGLSGLTLLGTTGCVSLWPESEPDTIYRLNASSMSNLETAQKAEVTVMVDRIVAPRGLSGSRIALRRDRAIAYMANAAWISPAPSLLESIIGEVLDSRSPVLASARVEDGVQAAYELDLELRDFEAVYDQGDDREPIVHVALRGRLIDRDERHVIATRHFTMTHRASENRQGAIIHAFSEASTRTASELADWVEASVCTHNRALENC